MKKNNWKDSFKKCWFDWSNGKLDDGVFGFDVTFNQGIYLKGRTSQIVEMCQEVIGMTPHTIKFNREWDEFTDEIYYVCVCYFEHTPNIDRLVETLTKNRESGILNGKKFYFSKEKTSDWWGFSNSDIPNCVVCEDWERYYKFDAAKDYDNPSEFVAECIIEEALNKIELESEFDKVIDELESKHK